MKSPSKDLLRDLQFAVTAAFDLSSYPQRLLCIDCKLPAKNLTRRFASPGVLGIG